eukprot:TRINITY_DN17792_c0_g1_i1.p1 TRINITY_DN17792_c0_g1~~TRINITY_DN17792_c0_g1_i1.p1  ORF type:complete len:645 (+),score=158.70 TRINITY_DN17792_c0_g1_i1:75-2009(+)
MTRWAAANAQHCPPAGDEWVWRGGSRDVGARIAEAPDRSALSRLLDLWQRDGEHLGAANTAAALHRCARLGCRLPERALCYLAEQTARAQGEWHAKHFANALFGLQHSPPSAGVRAIIGVLSTTALSTPITARTVGMALFGVRLQGDSPEMRALLSALTPRLAGVRALDGPAVPAALNGLQGQEDTAAVHALLGGLAPLVAACPARIPPRQLGTAALGLQNLRAPGPAGAALLALAAAARRSDCPPDDQAVGSLLFALRSQETHQPVQSWLSALVPIIRAHDGAVSEQAASNALYGLHRQTDTAETREVLEAVAGFVARAEAFKGQAVSCSLYGLGRQGDSPAVRSVLLALIPRVMSCPQVDSGKQVAGALYGLRYQRHGPEVEGMLSALVPPLVRCPDPLEPHAVALALFGLAGQALCTATCALFNFLTARIDHLPPSLPAIGATQCIQGLLALRMAGFDVSAAVAAVARRSPKQPRNRALRQLLLLAGAPAGAAAEEPPARPTAVQRASPSPQERAVRRMVQVAGVPGIAFEVVHQSGFELDMLCGRVNIELDSASPSYRSESKRRFFAMRDALLEHEHGISVVRVQLHGSTLREVAQRIGTACRAGSAAGSAADAWDRLWHLAGRGWEWWLIDLRQRERPR